jgi:tetratricopeptide (TPR) repeat protein
MSGRTVMFALACAILLVSGAAAADLSEAVDLIERQNYQRAELLLRQALTREEDAEAEYLLGFLLIATFRFEEAEQHLRSAVNARPQQPHWLMVLAKSLLEQGKNIAAGEVLEQAIAIDPLPAYYHAHAMAALNAGDLAAAEASLRACLALNAQHEDALFRLGVLMIDQGRSEEGIEYLERALAVNPANLECRYRLGTAYRNAGRLDDAEDYLNAVVDRVPGHVGALYNLSRVLIQSGNPEAAAIVMEQFRSMSKLRDEIDFIAMAVRKNPGNIDGRIYLVTLYLRAGRTQDALTGLLATRVLAPRDARIYRLLATAYRRLGDENNAVRAERFADSIEGPARG